MQDEQKTAAMAGLSEEGPQTVDTEEVSINLLDPVVLAHKDIVISFIQLK